MASSNIISIGSVPSYRGVYNDSTAYYAQNQVTMCGSLFQAISNNFSGIPPLVINEDDTASLINTTTWKCLIDNSKLPTVKLTERIEKAETQMLSALPTANSALETANAANAKIDEANKKLGKMAGLDVVFVGMDNFALEKPHVFVDGDRWPVSHQRLVRYKEGENVSALYMLFCVMHNINVMMTENKMSYYIYKLNDDDETPTFEVQGHYTETSVPQWVKTAFHENEATTNTPGLMGAGDKATLGKALTTDNTSCSVVTTEEDVDVAILKAGGEVCNFAILGATKDKAGTMTAADKTALGDCVEGLSYEVVRAEKAESALDKRIGSAQDTVTALCKGMVFGGVIAPDTAVSDSDVDKFYILSEEGKYELLRIDNEGDFIEYYFPERLAVAIYSSDTKLYRLQYLNATASSYFEKYIEEANDLYATKSNLEAVEQRSGAARQVLDNKINTVQELVEGLCEGMVFGGTLAPDTKVSDSNVDKFYFLSASGEYPLLKETSGGACIKHFSADQVAMVTYSSATALYSLQYLNAASYEATKIITKLLTAKDKAQSEAFKGSGAGVG